MTEVSVGYQLRLEGKLYRVTRVEKVQREIEAPWDSDQHAAMLARRPLDRYMSGGMSISTFKRGDIIEEFWTCFRARAMDKQWNIYVEYTARRKQDDIGRRAQSYRKAGVAETPASH